MSGYIKVKLDFEGLKEQKELIEGLIEYHKDDDAMIQLNGINRLLEFLISEGEEKGFYTERARKPRPL